MLINISTRPHPHIQHVGLYVDEVDETIKSLLNHYVD
nr:MAG TPA: Glyoxalase/bleomycin resistance protein [Caudoviricetes sp.]